MENNKGRDVLLVLGGACVGALIGVLLAPRAGEEMRQDVSEFGKNLWRKIPGNVKAAGREALREAHDRMR